MVSDGDDENPGNLAEPGPPITASRKPRKCPSCGAGPIAEILYGMPTEEIMRTLDETKFVLGGCCITDDDPTWQCTVCAQQIRRSG